MRCQHGGIRLRLYGQEDNGAVWAISRMNLLLHGIPDADIRNGDTLAQPKHFEDGRLMRFDRVIANPPFSQNYIKRGMQFTDRFRFGWCPTTGKKADLMFAQHMLATLKQTGKMAVVMPHGVLFRGGEEKKIRLALLQDGLYRGGHRPASEPFLWHRHSGLRSGDVPSRRQAGRAQGQGAFHKC